MGLLAHAYWLLMIGLPRVYLGLHHPTDVLGGGLIGAAIGVAFNLPALRKRAADLTSRWRLSHPASFYAALFLVVAESGTMFSDARGIISSVALWAGLGK